MLMLCVMLFRMDLLVFLEILWTLEGLLTDLGGCEVCADGWQLMSIPRRHVASREYELQRNKHAVSGS